MTDNWQPIRPAWNRPGKSVTGVPEPGPEAATRRRWPRSAARPSLAARAAVGGRVQKQFRSEIKALLIFTESSSKLSLPSSFSSSGLTWTNLWMLETDNRSTRWLSKPRTQREPCSEPDPEACQPHQQRRLWLSRSCSQRGGLWTGLLSSS